MLGDMWNGFIDFLGDLKRFPGQVMKVNTITLKNLLAAFAFAGAGIATVMLMSWWGLVLAYLAIPALMINQDNRQSILYIHTQLFTAAVGGQAIAFGIQLALGWESGALSLSSFLGMCIAYWLFGKIFPERT